MQIKQDKLDKIEYGIKNGFVWSDSPQGRSYWLQVYHHLSKMGANVRPQDRHIGGRIFKDLIRETIDALDSAFVWAKSPQGHDYWQKVREALWEMMGYDGEESTEESAVDAYDRAMGVI